MSAEAVPREDGPGWYLYGVVAADAAVDGKDDVLLVPEGDVAGVASRVSLDEFDTSVLPERLGDAAWLEEKIRVHEQVLEGVLESASVVPCRFCTVYRTEEELRRFLAERGGDLSAALSRVAGRVELGVKAFVREAEPASGKAASGREYLLRKQRARQLAATADERANGLALVVHERLASLAAEARANPPQRPELSGRRERMLLNGAYLVAAEREQAFADAVENFGAELVGDGVELELTGPWPPYNFADAGADE